MLPCGVVLTSNGPLAIVIAVPRAVAAAVDPGCRTGGVCPFAVAACAFAAAAAARHTTSAAGHQARAGRVTRAPSLRAARPAGRRAPAGSPGSVPPAGRGPAAAPPDRPTPAPP